MHTNKSNVWLCGFCTIEMFASVLASKYFSVYPWVVFPWLIVPFLYILISTFCVKWTDAEIDETRYLRGLLGIILFVLSMAWIISVIGE